MHTRQVILFNIKEVNYNQYIFLYLNPLNLFLHTSHYLQSSQHRNVVGKECSEYLTIIPRVRMGYWLRGHEGERKNCFSKIQLVG